MGFGTTRSYPAANTANQTHCVAGGEIAIPATGLVSRGTTRHLEAAKTTPRGFGAGAGVAHDGAAGWAALPGWLPELAELLAELLSCGGPIGLDGVAELCHVALHVQLVLLKPGNVQLLPRGSALELAGDVGFVVTDDSVGGWSA